MRASAAARARRRRARSAAASGSACSAARVTRTRAPKSGRPLEPGQLAAQPHHVAHHDHRRRAEPGGAHARRELAERRLHHALAGACPSITTAAGVSGARPVASSRVAIASRLRMPISTTSVSAGARERLPARLGATALARVLVAGHHREGRRVTPIGDGNPGVGGRRRAPSSRRARPRRGRRPRRRRWPPRRRARRRTGSPPLSRTTVAPRARVLARAAP